MRAKICHSGDIDDGKVQLKTLCPRNTFEKAGSSRQQEMLKCLIVT